LALAISVTGMVAMGSYRNAAVLLVCLAILGSAAPDAADRGAPDAGTAGVVPATARAAERLDTSEKMRREQPAQASASGIVSYFNNPQSSAAAIALVSSLVSIVVSLFSLFFNARNQANLEKYKAGQAQELEKQRAQYVAAQKESELDHQRQLAVMKDQLEATKKHRDARLDYMYEAKKRLYRECEPLLFQLGELSESALHRIYSLARTAKNGNLEGDDKDNWLANPEEYYTLSTFYYLLAPLVIFKLIQRRLTLIDLHADPGIDNQYRLMKRLFLSFTNHIDLARHAPVLEYAPHQGPLPSKEVDGNPARYSMQGIVLGRLDKMVESLITKDDQGHLRPMTYGEFERAYLESSKLKECFSYVADIVVGFHPRTKPVFWRILMTQVPIYLMLREARNADDVVAFNADALVPEGVRKQMDWRQPKDVEAGARFEDALTVATSYLTEHLAHALRRDQPSAG
jgi:hypothetical protein